jgi:Fibronectin type III domain
MRQFKRSKRSISLQLMLLVFLILFCPVSSLYAMDITLRWAPSNDPDVAGYMVFYREDGKSYNYNKPYWECTDTECTVYDLDITKVYYFVVRAFDNNGNTSNDSNEVALNAGSAVNNADTSAGIGGGGGGGCFIATAAYGSLLEPHVRLLCQFRDRFLLTNGPGKIFVKYYYKYSPPAAHFISGHAVLRALVCVFLLPLVGISWMLLKMGMGITLLFILLMGIGLVYIVKWRKNAVSLR